MAKGVVTLSSDNIRCSLAFAEIKLIGSNIKSDIMGIRISNIS